MPLSSNDPCSFSRPDVQVVKHVQLAWHVDFQRKIISGSATLNVERIDVTERVLILDVSQLNIKSISTTAGESLKFTIDEETKDIGSKLSIDLPENQNESLKITIEYETVPGASGLQWLDPLQTAGKKEPYLFSQFQAIHARSVVPCQDTPSVKFTYEARVSVSSKFTVLMSALRVKRDRRDSVDDHYFRQPVPIPAYLLAIAVGKLESRQLGPRSYVWAEGEMVESCAWEFANVDEMLKGAEQLCGEYVWGVYDILILPPSFPYGGMENPCLSFITPTLLAGDRSLVDVVVHEITHSWSGNLVTNKNFEHFWLNEGFTIFLERKITSSLPGVTQKKEVRDFHTLIGLTDLRETIEEHLGKDNPLTNLVVDLKGLNPDDAFSTVPYEKGSTFLRYLEELLGGPAIFDPFMRHYIKTFARKSIDTDDFKRVLLDYFKGNEKLQQVEWDKWLHTPGMPIHIPKYNDTLIKVCVQLAERWTAPGVDYSTFDMDDLKDMSSLQRREFLSYLHRANVTLELARAVESSYSFNASKNCEIKFKWLRVCIKARWSEKVDDVLEFINVQGRMKYVRPLYRDLYAWEAVRQRTVDNFLANEKYMMHVSAYTLRKDLHLT